MNSKRRLFARGMTALAALQAGLGARAVFAARGDLLVFAAASTNEVLRAAAAAWPGATATAVRFSFAGSSALARQLEQGAPADIFVSADLDWMEYLRKRGLLRDDTVRPLLGNRLVLIAPVDSGPPALRVVAGVDLAAALGDGRLALAEVRSVPAGRYARSALESIGAWAGVSERLAMSENVRAALALVARAEAPLGIVYESDARAEPRVRVVGVFPQDSHPPIRYPAAVVRSSRNPQASAFLDFLGSPRAAGIYRAHGFAPV